MVLRHLHNHQLVSYQLLMVASYSTFSKNVKEANSRREVEKRLAEIAAEADRRANEAQTEKVYHSTQLKEYIFNPARIAPLDVARKDY
jgi:hypothetical protein